MKQENNEIKIDIESMLGSELLELISWKDEYPQEAEQAFISFCARYEKDLLQKAEIYCSKFGYNEVDALLVANCTFARVWKYPTFNIKKAKSKNIDTAILLWMYPILYTQIILLGKKNTCADPCQEEDLSIVCSVEEMIDVRVGDEIEKKKELMAMLEFINNAMLALSEKHKIIYLTYKAYEEHGKNIPRSVSKKLQEQLDLTQNSIRVYKMEANQHIEKYLEQINGSK
ncbi:MAG: hypothetical protein JXI43_01915 [Tissierellales bacterium]|nr:hypothetical protein [Tissierellales bacterium]